MSALMDTWWHDKEPTFAANIDRRVASSESRSVPSDQLVSLKNHAAPRLGPRCSGRRMVEDIPSERSDLAFGLCGVSLDDNDSVAGQNAADVHGPGSTSDLHQLVERRLCIGIRRGSGLIGRLPASVTHALCQAAVQRSSAVARHSRTGTSPHERRRPSSARSRFTGHPVSPAAVRTSGTHLAHLLL